jgi:hypothetical protein
MHPRKSAALIGVLVTTAAVSGCGSGSSKVSAAAYVRSVCNAVGPFERQVAARSNALDPQSIKSPDQGKVALKSFLSAIATDTDTALSRLRAAGTPNVAGGTKIESTIVAAFAQLDKAMKSAATSADDLPTASPSAFQAAATTLGTTVRSSMNGIGSSLSALRSSTLEKAALKEPACSSLSKSS